MFYFNYYEIILFLIVSFEMFNMIYMFRLFLRIIVFV